MQDVLKEKVTERIIELRDTEGILDADLADLYEVRTAEINQAVRNNPKKFPVDLYYFETTREEKRQLIEAFERLESLKYSPHNPKFFNHYGIIMLSTVLTSEIAIEVCHIVVQHFVDSQDKNATWRVLETMREQQQWLERHDQHIQALAHEIHRLREQATLQTTRPPIGFVLPAPPNDEE